MTAEARHMSMTPHASHAAANSPESYLGSVRVSERDRARLALEIARDARPESRRYIRFPLSSRFPMFVRLSRFDGAMSFLRVSPRDISNLGVGFLHGAHLEPGRACEITVRARDGYPMTVPARIVYSQEVRNGVYEVGAAFGREIDVTAVLPVEGPAGGSLGTPRPVRRLDRYIAVERMAYEIIDMTRNDTPPEVLRQFADRLAQAVRELTGDVGA